MFIEQNHVPICLIVLLLFRMKIVLDLIEVSISAALAAPCT